MPTSPAQPRTIRRRTVALGAAWAVPAISVATAVPAHAAASPIVTVSSGGNACKLPGNSCDDWSKGYLQPLVICNKSQESVIVTIVQPATLTFNGTQKTFEPIPASYTIAPGSCKDFILNINLQDNSQQSTITGTLSWTWESTVSHQTGTTTTTINSATTPPCVNCVP